MIAVCQSCGSELAVKDEYVFIDHNPDGSHTAYQFPESDDVDEADNSALCHWYFDDGDEQYDEYRPHEFSGDGDTCVNCHAPKPKGSSS